MKSQKSLIKYNKVMVAVEIWTQSLLPTIEELFNQLFMNAIVETEPNVHLIMFNGKHCIQSSMVSAPNKPDMKYFPKNFI